MEVLKGQATLFSQQTIQLLIAFFFKVPCPYSRTWTPPSNWRGDLPAFYMDFETLECVELKNEVQHTNDGKVNAF